MSDQLTFTSAARLGRISTPNSLTILTIYILLLLAVPSFLRIPALSGVGYLAAIWGFVMAFLWAWQRAQGPGPKIERSNSLTKTCLYVVIVLVLVSYFVAMRHPMPAVEISQADMGLLRLASAAGVFLFAHDYITSNHELTRFLRRLTAAGALFASLGILQFLTKRSLIDFISIPGMISVAVSSAVIDRGTLVRAAATASHPLEYAAVLSMILPVSLSLALSDSSSRSLLLRWTSPLLIVVALLISGSRSGLVGFAVGMLVLIPTLPPKVRVFIVTAVCGLFGLMGVLIPGLIGTMRYLFLNIGRDPSSQSRSESYGIALDFFMRSPLIGRGFGTFLPTYRIFDNQLLLLLVELGLLGVVGFLCFFIAAAVNAIRAGLRSKAALEGSLGVSLGAGLIAGLILSLLFDSLSFPMAAGMLFLFAGLCAGFARRMRSQPSEQRKDHVTKTRDIEAESMGAIELRRVS